MGYVFQAFAGDVLTAAAPQLFPLEARGPAKRSEQQFASALLGTMLAVPAFRTLILQATGGAGLGGRAEILANVALRNVEPLPEDRGAPRASGLIRVKGNPAASALIDTRLGVFAAGSRDVRLLARHLLIAKEKKISRVITVSSTMPDQAFLAELKSHPLCPGTDKLRPLTWMATVDFALHLLERRGLKSPAEIFLLEQYVHFIKEAAIREQHVRPARPEGPLHFRSLGADWQSLVKDLARDGSVDPRDPRLVNVAQNWLAFLRYAAMFLTRSNVIDEDVVLFPAVRGNVTSRAATILKALRDQGQLKATLKKSREKLTTQLCADLRKGQILLQIELDGPSGRRQGDSRIGELADLIAGERTAGETKIKVFWPGEKQPRLITREQAVRDAIATAPPRHGLIPEKFLIERIVRSAEVMADPESFVQLLMLELRGFRVSMRRLLAMGLPDR